MKDIKDEIKRAVAASYIDKSISCEESLRHRLLVNEPESGKKLSAELEAELGACTEFSISTAFITIGGILPFLLKFKELEEKGVKGRILCTDYLMFTEPRALRKLMALKNIELRMFLTEENGAGFHTKAYIFKRKHESENVQSVSKGQNAPNERNIPDAQNVSDTRSGENAQSKLSARSGQSAETAEAVYDIIIGSANLTQKALTENNEWNIKASATEGSDYAQSVLHEFERLWELSAPAEGCIDAYEAEYEAAPSYIYERERSRALFSMGLSERGRLKPNSMQLAFSKKLKESMGEGKKKALLISATGTGKTYASAFAMKELCVRKLLFVVHREQIARAALMSFKNVFGNERTYGLLTGNEKESGSDFVFATIQTLSKREILEGFSKKSFDAVVIDEVHRAGAESYLRIMDYFEPEIFLGMTASPERTDGFDIFGLFDRNVVYEIRLEEALLQKLLCPFQYFGITDFEYRGESITELSEFRLLSADERVDYIIEKAMYYGWSGNRVRGLIFCSGKEEARALSEKFNLRGFKTLALTGEDSPEKREDAARRLSLPERTEESLDYIITVDIFNEGVDIPEINQVIMLRPTKSPVVFIQQLGRGLRKSPGKEFVVVLDFIANYDACYLIPIALSGDRSYNKDNIRRFLAEGSRFVPGAAGIRFDEISKKRIYASLDRARLNSARLIAEEYGRLKTKLGRIPRYRDFFDFGSFDINLIFENKSLGSYHNFLKKYEREYSVRLNKIQEEMLEFVSVKLARGKRRDELLILKRCIDIYEGAGEKRKEEAGTTGMPDTPRTQGAAGITGVAGAGFEGTYIICNLSEIRRKNTVKVLRNEFVLGKKAGERYRDCVFLERAELKGCAEKGEYLVISEKFRDALSDGAFRRELRELTEYGLWVNERDYSETYGDTDLCLYKKYTYEEVCRLLDWDKNINANAIGGYWYDRETKTIPVFINYDKREGMGAAFKYEDNRFKSPSEITAFSKPSRTESSEEIKKIFNASAEGIRIYLFIRKNKDDKIANEFYFAGEMSALGEPESVRLANSDKGFIKINYRLKTALREDLFEYFNL